MKADNPLLKKYGPLPGWAWVAVAGILGFAVYRWSKGGEESGVEEGYFPTQGIPLEEAAEAGGGNGGGIGGLSEDLQALAAAGFVPAGSEEARGEPGEPKFSPLEELLEEGFAAYLSGLMTPKGRAAKKAAGKKGAKGKAGKGGKGANTKAGRGKGGKHKPREVQHAKNPHVATQVHHPDHRGAASPRQRLKPAVGKGHPAAAGSGGGDHKKPKKKRRG